MVTVPWSAKGEKTTPGVALDELMIIDSEDIVNETKNKRMSYQNLADSLLDLASVAGLTDGEATRLSSAIVTFEDISGTKFKGSIRPNPTRQINALNQAQLENSILGSDLEIPDGVAITVVIDDDFTLTKPFKIGSFSSLEIKGSTVVTTLTYTGPGALFQNENVANPIRSILVRDILLRGDGTGSGSPGDGTNTIFDVNGVAFLVCDDTQMADFDSMGIVDFPIYRLTGFSPTNINVGLVVNNPLIFQATSSIVTQFIESNFTFFSFIMTGVGEVRFDAIVPLGSFANTALTYIPPTVPAGSQITVNRSVAGNGTIFQQGVQHVINSVSSIAANGGTAKTRFHVAAAHNLVVGAVVTLVDFSEPYNGTFIVAAVDTPITGVTFDIESTDLAFTNDDIGAFTAESLDGTDVRVLSEANTGTADSAFLAQAGLEIFSSPFSSVSLTQNGDETVIDAAWQYGALERFEPGAASTGELVCIDPGIKKYRIDYSGTIEKSGGGTTNIGIIISKNFINVSFNATHSVNAGNIYISSTDILELTDGDVVGIAVINYDATAAVIDVSQLNVTISEA